MNKRRLVTSKTFQGLILNTNDLSDVRFLEKNIQNFYKVYFPKINTKLHFIVTDTNSLNHDFAELKWREANPDALVDNPLFFCGDHFLITIYIENPVENVKFTLTGTGVRFFLKLTQFDHPLDDNRS